MATAVAHRFSFREWGAGHRKALTVLLALLVFAGVVVFWIWSKAAESRAIARMPAEQRAVLYRETFASTKSLCARAAVDRALRDRCVDSAEFLRSFPECDEACQGYVKQFTMPPAR